MSNTAKVVSAVLLLAIALTGIPVAHTVSDWEKAHGYPYGRMCDPNVFNLYVSTCK